MRRDEVNRNNKKRSGAGTVEMRFVDRMKALETLLELLSPDGEEQLESFLQRMEEDGT